MSQSEWRELESDPGLFTLLLEDFGVKGVQVEEIYELSEEIKETVYGFIFLFRWDSCKKKASRRSGRGSAGSAASFFNTTVTQSASTFSQSTNDLFRSGGNLQKESSGARVRSTSGSIGEAQFSLGLDENEHIESSDIPMHQMSSTESNELFFARQTVQNSCATHALLSVLLNRPELDLGPMLNEFQRATRYLPPEAKGMAIGNMPQLAQAHNRHAAPPISVNLDSALSPSPMPEPSEAAAAAASAALASTQGTPSNSLSATDSSSSTGGRTESAQTDTFHFVCYVPFGGFLYELDGLKSDPINHGPLRDPKIPNAWTTQCVEILRQRMQEQDVRYSLMAVVPDRRLRLTKRMCKLEQNRRTIENILVEKARFEAEQQTVACQSLTNGPLRDSPSAFVDPTTRQCTRMKCEDVAPSPSCRTGTPQVSNCVGDVTNNGVPESTAVSNTRDRFSPGDSSRSVQTRSSTRAASASVSRQTEQTSGEMAPSDSDQPKPTANHNSVANPLRSSTEFSRKRPSFNTILDDGEWTCDRKKSLLEPNQTHPLATTRHSDPSSDSANCSASSDHFTKLLASIVSADSPLLSTLTETVVAEAKTYDVDLKDDDRCATKSEGIVNCETTLGREERCSSRSGDQKCSPSGFFQSHSGSVSLIKKELESEHGSLCSPGLRVSTPYPNCVTCNHTGAGNQVGFSQNHLLSDELTKPLTVDTEFWHSTTSYAPSARYQPRNGLDKLDSPEKLNDLRPRTRALTRARVNNNTNRSNNLSSNNASTTTTALLLRSQRATSDAALICKASPGLVSSPIHSPPTQVEVLDREDHKSSPVPDEQITAVTSNRARLNGTDRTCSARPASKYPTRSSTRRDTLASHNLAQFRSQLSVVNSYSSTSNNSNALTSSSTVMSNCLSDTLRSDYLEGKTSSPLLHNPTVTTRSADCLGNNNSPLTIGELQVLLKKIKEHWNHCSDALMEEETKRHTYRIDDARRVHDYVPFIRAYLRALVKHDMLHTLVLQALQSANSGSPNTSALPTTGNRNSPRVPSTGFKTNPRQSELDSRSASNGFANCSAGRSTPNHGGTPVKSILNSVNPNRTRLRARTRLSLTTPSNPVAAQINSVHVTRKSRTLSESSTERLQISVNDEGFLDSAVSTIEDVPTERPLFGSAPSNSPTYAGSVNKTLTVSESANCQSEGDSTSELPTDSHSTASTIGVKNPSDFGEAGSMPAVSYSPVMSSTNTGASYSSCGSPPQSPQSTSSSRSTYLRPRPFTSNTQTVPEGNISRKSLRPRSHVDQNATESQSESGESDGRKSRPSGRSSLRRKIPYALVRDLDMGNGCKPAGTSSTLISSVPDRFRKRRLC
ncbi:hypothetical protein CRM22_010025 [Opisthorchis felineus]|uniref:ubiquitinyl hydrolase 1 n=1 Tax=Opisthorchis felineus TaxID=147828 RepID=A0A4S2L395_OPIFE|nr:hypothetical protein CRM22_010025 [Opisthorchis felineus]